MSSSDASSRASFLPRRLTKLEGRRAEAVADHGGVFRVQRVVYEPTLAHDVFVLASPDWCNVLAETDDGELVLVWQYRFGTDALSLEVPGGVIDPGEAPIEAARRELREETGYEADSFELVSVVEPNPALQGNRCFTFLARGVRPTGQIAFDELEDLETVLVPRHALARLIDEQVITHALVVVALETYLRKHTVRAGP
ncbi:MAG TPA: NUDIX hydrolase [Labilithrix sp.]|nr:NUDIX hydrolase [Labilithrix sp.]